VESPEPYAPPPGARGAAYEDDEPEPRPLGLWVFGERLTWISGLVLALSAFTGWYAGSGSGEGPTLAVIGWHTGALGKLVFLIGLAVIALTVLREAGIALPAAVPESLVVIVLGSIATVCVLIRLISIPDEFFPFNRGIGIWISLLAAVLVIVAGLLRATDEL
jgi:hypothetical protein